MFEAKDLPNLQEAVRRCTESDKGILDELRQDARALAQQRKPIRKRTTTAVSLVASDGGNNKLSFDPFLIQLVRVVDSYGKQLCLDAVSPSTNLDNLSDSLFKEDGTASGALGQIMIDLQVEPRTLRQLSHMIPTTGEAADKPSWLQVYRDLWEWAVLYDRICYKAFATSTLIVRDGLLRSKLFRGENFIKLKEKMWSSIQRIADEERMDVFLVGVAKHSKVLDRYRLAMMLEDTLPAGEPCYVPIPTEIEQKVYKWAEWARGAEAAEEEAGEAPKFTAGRMYFVRFGSRTTDPVWCVDIFEPQVEKAGEIFGYLLADAIEGFPIPLYPRCLQRAHEYAEIVDFDLEILQDEVVKSVRQIVAQEKREMLDTMRLQSDVSTRRYQ